MILNPGVKFLFSNGGYLLKVSKTEWHEILEDEVIKKFVEVSAKTDPNGNNLKVMLQNDAVFYLIIEDRTQFGFNKETINSLLSLGSWTNKDGSKQFKNRKIKIMVLNVFFLKF